MKRRTAIAIALVCLSPAIATAQLAMKGDWYASDPAGIVLERIAGPADSEYALLVARSGDTVRSELYRDGAARKAWLRTYGPEGILAREALEEDGAIREEVLYDDAGRPRLERTFVTGGEIEETAYEYIDGRLVSKRTTRGDEEPIVSTYLYAPDGRLALAKQSGGRSFGTDSARTGAFSSWRAGPGGLELRNYDSDGRLVAITAYAGAAMLSRESRTWKDGVLASTVIEDGDGGRIVTDYVNEGPGAGKPGKITTELKGVAVSVAYRRYDTAGRLSVVEKTGNGQATVIEYGYDDAGAVSSVRTSEDGLTVSVVSYESATTRVEELYDGGVAFVRVRYEDGRRTLEEMLRDGRVVRSRSFE